MAWLGFGPACWLFSITQKKAHKKLGSGWLDTLLARLETEIWCLVPLLIASTSREYINYTKNPMGCPMNMVKAGDVTERGTVTSLVLKGLL